MTHGEFARQFGFSRPYITNLIHGRRHASGPWAQRLASATKTNLELWIDLTRTKKEYLKMLRDRRNAILDL